MVMNIVSPLFQLRKPLVFSLPGHYLVTKEIILPAYYQVLPVGVLPPSTKTVNFLVNPVGGGEEVGSSNTVRLLIISVLLGTGATQVIGLGPHLGILYQRYQGGLPFSPFPHPLM